ncbi:MAG: hypothetical protein QW667_04775 [Candidatus Bathyarchaeia archaeon]
MTEDEKRKAKATINLSSKFWKTFSIVAAAFLTFAGPTYLVYLLLNVLDVDYAVSMLSGLTLFVIGFIIMLYLVKNKVIS